MEDYRLILDLTAKGVGLFMFLRISYFKISKDENPSLYDVLVTLLLLLFQLP